MADDQNGMMFIEPDLTEADDDNRHTMNLSINDEYAIKLKAEASVAEFACANQLTISENGQQLPVETNLAAEQRIAEV